MWFQNATALASKPSLLIMDIVICVGVTAKLMTDIFLSACPAMGANYQIRAIVFAACHTSLLFDVHWENIGHILNFHRSCCSELRMIVP